MTTVVAARDSKRIPELATGKKGETVSCCSATGVLLPSSVNFKFMRAKAKFSDDLPHGSPFMMTQSGYMQSISCQKFIKLLLNHKPPAIVLS